ncbi:MAG: S41 family peptidase [Caldilineaceae bacterium]
MIKGRLSTLLLLVCTSLIWFLIGWIMHSRTVATVVSLATPENQLIAKAQQALLHSQYNTSSAKDLAYGAIQGLIQQTHDPYAHLFRPPASRAYYADLADDIGAPGLWFDIIDGKMVVIDVTPNKPAAQAGIKEGDILLGVDGTMFDDFTSGDEASILLRGPAGSTVDITVQRGEKVQNYKVARVTREIISSSIITHEIGYIRQNLFPLHSEEQVKNHLNSLLKSQVRALIWDLRDSRGGAMSTTAATLSYFVAPNIPLYTADFLDGQQLPFESEGNTITLDLPLVVLINNRTYSSSEMAAVALAENNRATLIGTKTSGKGTIQDVYFLDEDHLLRMSIAKWLSPTGRWLEGQGVAPTIEVTDDSKTTEDEVLDFAVDYIQEHWLQQVLQSVR